MLVRFRHLVEGDEPCFKYGIRRLLLSVGIGRLFAHHQLVLVFFCPCQQIVVFCNGDMAPVHVGCGLGDRERQVFKLREQLLDSNLIFY